MSICQRCNATFGCGMADASGLGEPCWCTRLPVLPTGAYVPCADNPEASRCFCPDCLRVLVDAAAAPKAEGR